MWPCCFNWLTQAEKTQLTFSVADGAIEVHLKRIWFEMEIEVKVNTELIEIQFG